MLQIKEPDDEYVISKVEMEDWVLYSVEDTPYGKIIQWTRNYKLSLVFTTEEKIKEFIKRFLGNAPVNIEKSNNGVPIKKDTK